MSLCASEKVEWGNVLVSEPQRKGQQPGAAANPVLCSNFAIPPDNPITNGARHGSIQEIAREILTRREGHSALRSKRSG